MVKGECPRVLINLDRVGGIGSGKNDLVLLGKCDDIIRDLAKALGWEEELDKAWAATAASLENDGTTPSTPSTPTKRKDQTDGTDLASEVEKIVEKLEGGLTISEKDKPDTEADKSIQATGEKDKRGQGRNL
jgi:NAD-dependent histone deacetylase SIR2